MSERRVAVRICPGPNSGIPASSIATRLGSGNITLGFLIICSFAVFVG
jgi:hypothetical protein